MDKNHKIIIIALSILSILFISCGIFGFILHKKEKNTQIEKPAIVPQSNTVTYKYYLENEEMNDIPKNKTITNEDGTTETETLYIYKKFSCQNGTEGDFNLDKWKFTPKEEKRDVCSLYFVKSKYNIKLNINNAIESEENIHIIDRENNGVFKITPNEGYIFNKVTCTNSKEATWNEKDKTLTLNVVMQDTECDVNFEKKQLKINLTVKNGTGSITENVYYGDSKSIIVTPNQGFKEGKLSCTNNQIFTFNNNTIYFEKLTNNTTCTLTYSKEKINTFSLDISDLENNETISLISEKTQTIKSGETGKIILRTTEKNTPQLNCSGIIPNINEIEKTENSKTIEYIFYDINQNITCKVE